jgi:hypothetical protein
MLSLTFFPFTSILCTYNSRMISYQRTRNAEEQHSPTDAEINANRGARLILGQPLFVRESH